MEIPFVVTPRKDTGLFNSKIGIWLFLASEVMLFGGFFSAYVFLRIYADYPWPERTLPVLPGLINTFVLIASSVTVVFSWAALKMRKWRQFQVFMSATILAAVIFMVLKGVEYNVKFKHQAVRLDDYSVVEGHLDYIDKEHTIEENRINFEVESFKFDLTRFHEPYVEDILAQVAGKEVEIKLSEDIAVAREPGGEPELIQEAGTALTLGVLEDLRSIYLEKRTNDSAARTAALRIEWREVKDEIPTGFDDFLAADPKHASLAEDEQERQFVFWRHGQRAKQVEKALIDEDRLRPYLMREAARPSNTQLPSVTFNVDPATAFSFEPQLIREQAAKGKLKDDTELKGKLLESPMVFHDVDAIDFRWTAQRAEERGLDPDQVIESSWLLQNGEVREAWEWHKEQVAKKRDYLREKYGTRTDPETGRQRANRVPTDTERYWIGWKDFVARTQGRDMGKGEIELKEHFMGPDYDARREARTFPHLEVPREKVAYASKFTPAWNTYYAIYFAMTGLHGLHVIGGAIVLAYYLFFGRKMFLSNPEWLANRVEVGGLFWHFVDLVWIFLFPVLYLM
jgi:heme/copper-type cytochrome/quinol oxidase subunit 3